MTKKLFFSIFLIICSIFMSALFTNAQGYVFTVTEDFPLPYSSSIKVTNARHGIYTADSLEDIEPFIEAGIVKSYSENYNFELLDYTPSDQYYTAQYNIPMIYAPFAWSKGNFGKGVKIAVIDSGLYHSVYDISGIVRAYDCTAVASTSPLYCNDNTAKNHGTRVAGIIAATHNFKGISGIAPQCTLYIFKCVQDNGNISLDDIVHCIYSAVDDFDCDIINLSLGIPNSDPPALRDAIAHAEAMDVLVVAAAGNNGNKPDVKHELWYPASYDSVVSVGSVTADGSRHNISQKNDLVNIMAPGDDIISVTQDGYNEPDDGTSYSAPHVTAAAALAKALNPNLSAKELRAALYATATPMPRVLYSGNGLLNIQALLTYVQSTLSGGKVIYSSNDETTYSYLSPPEGYTIYKPSYEDNMLISVSRLLSVPYSATTFKAEGYLIWGTNTLTPYEGEFTHEEY